MKNDARTLYLMREKVLKLLSDGELARVSSAGSAPRLAPGDEYLDLEALDQGVRRALRTEPPMGRVLLRKVLQEETWDRILRELVGTGVAPPHSGGLTNDSY